MNFEPYLETIRDRVRNRNEYPIWDWTRGGCFAFVEKFVKIIGGKEYGICILDDEKYFVTYHAIVKYKGKYCDAKGEVDFEFWKREYPEMVIKANTDSDICWFEDDWLNDEEWEELEVILGSLKEQFKNNLRKEFYEKAN